MNSPREKLRSTRGCMRCRLRRKKCDEIRPVCGACSRLGLLCPYPSLVVDNTAASTPGYINTPQLRWTLEKQALVISQLECDTGPSQESHMILQHFCNKAYDSLPPPNRPDTAPILGLLPLVSSQPLLLSALATVLAAHLPADFEQRSHITQTLSKQTAHLVSHALTHNKSLDTTCVSLFAYALLHIVNTHQVHSGGQRMHLRSCGLILRSVLQQPEKASGLLALVTFPFNLGLYIFISHTVICSTIDYSLILEVGGPTQFDRFVSYIEYVHRRVDDNFPTPVPLEYLRVILRLARLRHEIIIHDVSQCAIREVVQMSYYRNPQQAYPRSLSEVARILYRCASLIFQRVLLQRIGVLQENSPIDIYSYCAETTVRAALTFARADPQPSQSLIWPLFVIGLHTKDEQMRASIRSYFTTLVTKQSLLSVQTVLNFLDDAWSKEYGTSGLLSAELATSLAF